MVPLVAALAAVDMIEARAAAAAGMEAAIMETAVVAVEAIAAAVEAGRKAEEEGLPAPGLVRVSANAM